MPLTYEEAKHEILFHYCEKIDLWYKIVGEMFEATKGFKNSATITCIINCLWYTISWTAYDWSWHIDKGR